MKFKEGDIIIGNEAADDTYMVTVTGTVWQVVESQEELIVIVPAPEKYSIYGKIVNYPLCDKFYVNSEHFDMVEVAPRVSLSEYIMGGAQ